MTCQTTTSDRMAEASTDDGDRLPLAALLVMALMGFLLIATETMPAGLLPQIAVGLSVSEGVAGQFVSAFALGTVIAAIPAVALTRGMRRKPVFIVGILGILAANVVTALSSEIALSLAARFVGGAFAGLVWGMTAGYARRITAPRYTGRALAIASIGVPLGLAVGTPFGSWLGATSDWRWSFGTLAVLTLITAVLAALLIPDAPGQAATTQIALVRVLHLPGVAVILAVIVAWMLAHNIVYTYISAYLSSGGLDLSVDVALVTFGVAALLGIGVTGAVIDHTLRPLVLTSIALFIAAGALFIVGHHSVVAVLMAIVLWGLAFGGAAAQLQTAISIASGDNADVANSMLGVAFNLAIFAAGVVGAVVIGNFDGIALPIVMVVLALTALTLAFLGRRTAFPMRP
ncbi:MFS transporter [Nocardioides sp. Root140]|uniref:MFS transporter n=1 Tax=Nocardioides sp. Root140 TaxID=1736460 RepID=UPI000A4DE200|nr:MFS transporter [Nocardioides sp. Root140]